MINHDWLPSDPVMPVNLQLDEQSNALFRAAHWNVAFTGIIHINGNPPKVYLRPLIAIREGNADFGEAVTAPDYDKHGAQQRVQKRPDTTLSSAGLVMGGSAPGKTLFHPNYSPQGRNGMLYGKEVKEPLAGHVQICSETKHPIEDCVGFAVTKREVGSLITCNSRTCNSSKFFGQRENLDPKRREIAMLANRAQKGSTAEYLGSGNMPAEWMQLVAVVLQRELGKVMELPVIKKRVFAGTFYEEGDMPSPDSKPIKKPVPLPPGMTVAPPPPPPLP